MGVDRMKRWFWEDTLFLQNKIMKWKELVGLMRL